MDGKNTKLVDRVYPGKMHLRVIARVFLVQALLLNHVEANPKSSVGTDLAFPVALSRMNSADMVSISIQTKLPLAQAMEISSKPNPGGDRKLRNQTNLQGIIDALNSVVMILTDRGIASGTIISTMGDVLTNWHVVQDDSNIIVIIQSRNSGSDELAIHSGEISSFDEEKDLAIVKVRGVEKPLQAIELGDLTEIKIGSDVHAIGHPRGKSWTYTLGHIIQFTDNYQWKTVDGRFHKANVIKTRTATRRGNSGGPLLSDKGRLIGLNSFKQGCKTLNFAVSVNEIKKFLVAQANLDTKCSTASFGLSRSEDNTSTLEVVDTNCDGEADGIYTKPYDSNSAAYFEIDSSADGKIDLVLVDQYQDGRWDTSLYDTDADGEIDTRGFHPDGEPEASTFRPYRSQQSARENRAEQKN